MFETAGTNVADAFRDLSNVDTVYAYDGSVGFGIPFLGTNWENLLFPRLSLDQDSYYGMLPSHALPGNSGVPSGLVEYRSED